MKKSLIILSIGLLGLAACSQQPTQKMPTETVMIVQPNDDQLTCVQLEPQIDDLQFKTAEMMKIKRQRENHSFSLKVLMNMTFAFLSGPTAFDRIETRQGFSEEEMARLESLKQRHQTLLELAKQKSCGFVPKVEERMRELAQPDRSAVSERQRINQ